MIETRSERFCFDCAPTGIHNTSYKVSGGQVTIPPTSGTEFRFAVGGVRPASRPDH